MEYSKNFTTKYDDTDKSKTVEVTSIIDAKIDDTIKHSTKVLENQDVVLDFPDYDRKGFEGVGLKIVDVDEYKKQMKKLLHK